MLRKNVAGQFLHFVGVNATTGAALSGLTWTVRRCLDGTFAAATGTVTEDTGLGFYKFALSQADTNGNNCAIFATASGAVPICLTFITTACDPTSVAFGLAIAKTTNITGFNDIAATAVVSDGAITTSGGAVSTVTAVTNAVVLPSIPADWITAAGIAAGAITSSEAPALANLDATVSSRLASASYTAPDNATIAAIATYVDTEVGAIKTKTDQLVFTKANQLDVNTLSVNGVTLVGNGTTEPMRAA